jgi:single-strand DNA-binding protein
MNQNMAAFTGNLTKDPELRYTNKGAIPYVILRVAVNGSKKDPETGQWVDVPGFYNVVVWRNRAVACSEHLEKGSPIAVEGRLDWREWTDDDEKHREAVQIQARHVQFLGRRGGEGVGEGEAEPLPEAPEAAAEQEVWKTTEQEVDELELAAVGAGEEAEEEPVF